MGIERCVGQLDGVIVACSSKESVVSMVRFLSSSENVSLSVDFISYRVSRSREQGGLIAW